MLIVLFEVQEKLIDPSRIGQKSCYGLIASYRENTTKKNHFVALSYRANRFLLVCKDGRLSINIILVKELA